MAILDITRPLGPDTPVWPGDSPVEISADIWVSPLGPVTSSTLRTAVHAGTHMDAPRHLVPGASGVDDIRLERCMGLARVVDVGDASSIGSALLSPTEGVERLLLKSRCSSGEPQDRHSTFPALDPSAAEALLRSGLSLLGVDSPSVDPAHSEDLPVHHLLLGAGVVLLENLWLADVEPGDYELIALPLRLVGSDGSPVRAVLRTLPTQ